MPACNAGCARRPVPEKVITLKPQLDFRAATASARVLKEEQPFCCIRCGKPFGVKSTIERVAAKLEGKHWMYKDAPRRLDVIKMCDDCRVAVVSEQDFDPYGSPPRAPVAHDRGLSARARGSQEKVEGRKLSAQGCVAFSRNLTSAARSSAPTRCSGILVPGV